MAANFTEDNIKELKYRLEDAAIKCSERCLYQSAKWYDARALYLPFTFLRVSC
jgi:hypothetical protein